MTTIRNADGTTVTKRTEVRCGLPSDSKLLGFRVEHVPGRRGAILHLETETGALALDVHHLQCGDLLNALGLSQRQAWEDDCIPDDLLEGERSAPPPWVGRVPDSRNVVQMRRRA